MERLWIHGTYILPLAGHHEMSIPGTNKAVWLVEWHFDAIDICVPV